MPIYEFKCEACGKLFDELCSLSTAERMRCPACGAQAKRRLSAFAVKSGGSFQPSTGGGCSSCSSGSCASCSH